jgi:4-hydroxy-2-oxoheptanedioate aldolase
MKENLTKLRLREGGTVLGCWSRYGDATLIEYVAFQGWDFVVLDGEHGTLAPRDCENAVRAAELRDVTPLVRVTTNEPSVILRFMDTGAMGAHVPMVNSAEAAESAIQAIKYGPRGSRGLAAARSAGFGLLAPYDEYVARSNQETLVVVQIETPEAVAAVPDILAVPDVDVVFLGLTDLSQALGVPGQTGHPDVERAAHQVTEAVTSSGAALGVLVGSAAAAVAWRDRGARYIAVSLEGLVRESSLAFQEAVRA